ncbi:sensor histidine kinase [Futiania mangrovi]|uniref:histidine kinase n=1 Tax=Futiania mangrovi TaxID=2959716 RepID=A0A9J6P8X0_9PROT|nr:HAMP domain-containing sensor histidine kinase [Futiania mangrovii]MCP1336244.1 HAMP domain-containing histidine kinase [Futiania mangrovii]
MDWDREAERRIIGTVEPITVHPLTLAFNDPEAAHAYCENRGRSSAVDRGTAAAAVAAWGLLLVIAGGVLDDGAAHLALHGANLLMLGSLVAMPACFRAIVMMAVLYLGAMSGLSFLSQAGGPVAEAGLLALMTLPILFAVRHRWERAERTGFALARMLETQKRMAVDLAREAKAASRSKSEFLAVVSHELRTPLNAIIGFSDIVRGEMFGPYATQGPRYRDYAEDIHASGRHLLSIINDILDLMRAESGKIVLHEEDVCPSGVLADVHRLLREQAGAKGVALDILPVAEGDRGLVLCADPRLLRQALLNLGSNAIKFTHPGGRVAVETVCDPAGFAFIVRDNGIGIAERDLGKVLEPFERVETALTRTAGGTGLGLPLVKQIAEQHGGRLILASKLGIGTTATVRLPAARVKERPAEAGQAAA